MGTLKQIENKMKRRVYVPVHDNPSDELRLLVDRHMSLTKTSVALDHMRRDRNVIDPTTHKPKKGEKIKCKLPEDVRDLLEANAKHAKHEADLLQTPMRKQLRQLPIYEHFLSKVYGCGPVVAAYIAAEVDIHRAVKSSALRMFFGLAVVNGRLIRRTRGQKNTYNSGLRTRIYQMFSAMMKNGRRDNNTSKYLTIWDDYRHRAQCMAEPEKPAKALSKGRWKAADVFVEDLYTIWRTLEGLPVWPSYHAAKLGYEHGGRVCVNEPRVLTLDEALAVVGEVGAVPIIEVAAAE